MRGPQTPHGLFRVADVQEILESQRNAGQRDGCRHRHPRRYDRPAGCARRHGHAEQRAGEYCYTLRTALPEHAYTATIVVSYLGQSYTSTQTVPATNGRCRTDGGNSPAQSQDLGQAIAENAMSAESVQSAAGSQKSHPLTEQIAADQYLASKRAAKRGWPGIRVMRREGNPSG